MYPCTPSGSRVGEAQHLSDHVAERLGGPDLMIGPFAQQRLDRPQMLRHTLQFAGCFAERITGPRRQPPHQEISRSAEQDDQVKA